MRETKVLLNICHRRTARLARPSDNKAFHGLRWCTYCTRDHCTASAQQLQDWQCTRLLKEEHDKLTRISSAFGNSTGAAQGWTAQHWTPHIREVECFLCYVIVFVTSFDINYSVGPSGQYCVQVCCFEIREETTKNKKTKTTKTNTKTKTTKQEVKKQNKKQKTKTKTTTDTIIYNYDGLRCCNLPRGSWGRWAWVRSQRPLR